MSCVVAAALVAGCGGSNPQHADAASNDAATVDATPGGDSANPDAPSASPVYAHTNTTLFQVDPAVPTTTMVGAFDCIGGVGQDAAMTDLAVDRTQTIWGISAHDVYQLSIQGSTVHCATTIALPGASPTFYGLSLAPVGTLDPTNEVLVAADTAGELWSVGAQGQLTQHGTLGVVPADDGHGHTYANAGQPWELAGDIVMLANSGSPVGYATVRDCPSPPSTLNCDAVDTLVALDMTKLAQAGTQSVVASVRGQIVKGAGCSDTAAGYGSLYGIAASGGSVIGFSHTGSIVRVSEADGTGCVLATSTDVWSGAATSTLAAP